MDSIRIRKATTDDISTLLKFEQGVISAERPLDPTIQRGDIHYYDLPDLIQSPDAIVLVADNGTELVGCGYARKKPVQHHFLDHEFYAYLGFMYTVPEHRGKGINQRIVEELKKWAAENNLKEIRLEVYNGNAGAIRAYEKAGFVRHMVEMRINK